LYAGEDGHGGGEELSLAPVPARLFVQ
jgi:hypothetical protein